MKPKAYRDEIISSRPPVRIKRIQNASLFLIYSSPRDYVITAQPF